MAIYCLTRLQFYCAVLLNRTRLLTEWQRGELAWQAGYTAVPTGDAGTPRISEKMDSDAY